MNPTDLLNLDSLSTEAADPRFARVDLLPVDELAALMNEADRVVPDAVGAALPQIVPAIEAVIERMRNGGRLIYVGAGTPGRIGVLDASECPPTFATPPEQVFAVIAGGPSALTTAVEGAEDDSDGGAQAMDDSGIGENDSVIGLTSSGRTPFVLAAVRRARELGALTVGLSCNESAELSPIAEHAIEVLVGPELISGSTRLKAGTAQKLVLNMFSTIAMIGLGKTYGNLMVDLVPTNKKLERRAIRMVATIGGVGADDARTALDASNLNIKAAVLRLLRGLDPLQAELALTQANGRLRTVLEETA